MSEDCSTWRDEEWSDRGIHLDQLYWRKCLITTILRGNNLRIVEQQKPVSNMADNSPVDEMIGTDINCCG